ncbi:MAG TPA: hypothetical protein VM260_26615 [Pirellula sp.]|nr:hypothetical protein [Pirellula sp.]
MFVPNLCKLKPLSRSWFLSASLVLIASFVLFELTASAALAQDRPQALEGWTDNTGEKTLSAEFVKLEGVSLTLRKADGKEIVLSLNKLDDKSRLKARAMAKNGGRSPLAKSTVPVSFPSNLTAQEFMDIILPELKNNNPMVMWDALPAAKQKQVQEVVSLASSRIEQRTMNLIKKFRSDLFTTLKSKKQFVLNSSALPIPPDQKDLLAKSYDSIVAMLEAYVPIEWLDASYLQNAELRDALSSYVHNIVLKGKDLENSLPDNSPFKSMINRTSSEAKVESVSANEAMVTFVVPGQPEIPSKFILSEGRWLPESLLAGWDKAMGQATGVLGQLDPKLIHQSVGKGLLVANGLLGSISSAETQQEFDEALGQLVGMAQMIPGMAGGAVPPGNTPPSNGPAKGRPGLQQSR